LATFVSFPQLLLIASLALAFLVIAVVWLKKRSRGDSTLLRTTLAEPDLDFEPFSEELASLLVFEGEYPAFLDILGLVFRKFSVARFSSNPEFRSGMEFLGRAPFQETNPQAVQSAICALVYALLEDPDVEYGCRPELHELVDDLLQQIDEPVGS